MGENSHLFLNNPRQHNAEIKLSLWSEQASFPQLQIEKDVAFLARENMTEQSSV